jgi:GT2 family glycosyltransferase
LRAGDGTRPEIAGAEFYDLTLRAIEASAPEQIRHVPFPVYHRQRRNEVLSANGAASRDALTQHFARLGQHGVRVAAADDDRSNRIIRPVPVKPPLVSIVMPTGGKIALLKKSVAGVLSETDYENIELIVLYNSSTRQDAFAFFEEIGADPRVSIVDSRGGFNFSRIVNLGVAKARGDVICLLNDDIAVIHPDWLKEMVSHAVRPEVGAVGAMLYYPDERIQHAGVVLGLGDVDGIAAHVHRRLPRHSPGYFRRAALTQNLSCVTAACMLVRRDVYLEVGGYDEKLVVDFNDVDFCIKLRGRGYLVVWTPFAELYHFEAVTRGSPDTLEKQKRFSGDVGRIREKWARQVFDRDPYFNPNFSRDSDRFEIAETPRIAKPWDLSPR